MARASVPDVLRIVPAKAAAAAAVADGQGRGPPAAHVVDTSARAVQGADGGTESVQIEHAAAHGQAARSDAQRRRRAAQLQDAALNGRPAGVAVGGCKNEQARSLDVQGRQGAGAILNDRGRNGQRTVGAENEGQAAAQGKLAGTSDVVRRPGRRVMEPPKKSQAPLSVKLIAGDEVMVPPESVMGRHNVSDWLLTFTTRP